MSDTKAPKTETGRRIVPILELLFPVLESTRRKAGELIVATLPSMGDRLAGRFREHLATAKIDRPRLTADNETEEPVDFRSLRDT